MRLYKAPPVIKTLYPGIIWDVKTEEKALYLTFDDGPTPSVTEWVLDLLQLHQAKATFFCIGKNVAAHPKLYDQVLREGHKTGNHTFDHLNLRKTSLENYLTNIDQAAEVIDSPYFRPPYGKFNRKLVQQLEQNGLKMVLWDFLTYDFDAEIKPEKVMEKMKRQVRRGSIIVFHDSKKAEKNLKALLPWVLKYFGNDFQFKALP